MRSLTKNIPFYHPEPIQASTDLNRYLENELLKIARAIAILAAGHVEKVHVPPLKPREGDLALADGTNWNPGAGAGIYAYYSGSWSKLG